MTVAMDREAVAQMRDAVRAFAREVDGVSRVRAEAPERGQGLAPDSDREVWRRLSDELGMAALVVPEKCGGLAAGEVAAALALEELGYQLEPAPAWSSINAARALAAEGESSDALDGLLAGALVGTMTGGGPGRPAGSPVRLGADGRLDGIARAVPDGLLADVIVASVDCSGTSALALVTLDEVSGRRRPLAGTDLVRTYADVDLGGLVAGSIIDDPAVVSRLRDQADVSMAAELLGGARACLDRTVDYLMVREQFGRVIGSFQALQHTVAALAVQIEQARALLDLAVSATDAGDLQTARGATPLARAAAAETFAHGADVLIHLNGGMGFTWEHDAHLFYRRARSAAVWGGTPAFHYAEAARRGCARLLNAG